MVGVTPNKGAPFLSKLIEMVEVATPSATTGPLATIVASVEPSVLETTQLGVVAIKKLESITEP